MLDRRYLKIILVSVLVLAGQFAEAQVPVINNISIKNGTVNETVLILGDNFPTNAANLKVNFGAASGNIVSATSGTVEVEVPAGSTTDNINLVNLSNGLSGYSGSQFFLSYSGEAFDQTLIGPEILYPSTVELFDLCLCDFNNDGLSDIATTKIDVETDILVYQNNSTVGNINFTERNKTTNPELDLSTPTSNITCGDLDGDGRQDLIVTKSGNPRNVVYYLRNITSGANIQFSSASSLFLGNEEIAKRVEIKDLDIDGKPEIIVSNTFDENIQVFRNTSSIGNIQFSATPILLNIQGAGTTNGLAVEDVNNDGLPDIITNPFFGSNIYISINRSTPGNFNFNLAQSIVVPGNLNNISTGDFNNDGLIDIAVTKTIQNEISVLVNQTAANSNTVSFTIDNFAIDGNPWGLNATDINGDGKIDLLVALRNTNNINILENTGPLVSVNFTKHSIPSTYFTRNIVGGDVDGDAKPDILSTTFDDISQYAISIFRNENCFVPHIDPTGPLTICAGALKTLSADKGIGIEYRWDKDNIVFKVGTEDTVNISTAGVYKVVGTSESGSCVRVSNAVIANSGVGTVPTNPIIYNNGPFCQGEYIILTTDTVVGATYDWNGPDSFTSSDQNISIPDASAINGGVYTLQVTVGECSSDISSSIVDVITLPEFTVTAAGPTKVCEGNAVRLSTTQIAGYNYQWLNNNNLISGATNYFYDAIASGTHSVRITQASSSCLTYSTNTIDISVIARPIASFTYEGLECENSSIQFTNTSTYEFGESVGYSWDFGDGSWIVNNENPTHTYLTSGNFTIAFSIAYSSGACRDTVFTPVNIAPGPVFEILRDPTENVCEGEGINLTTSAPFDNYLWSTGENTQSIDVVATGTYNVIVSNLNTCPGEQSLFISMLTKPDVSAFADPNEVEGESVIQLDASGALTYNWTPADIISDPNIPNPEAVVTTTTVFTVIGENADGCIDSASVVVTVLESNTIKVDPRNVFSPNGDGIDDYWIIEDIENYPGSSIVIYNGNGSVVYEKDNYNNEWDAVYNGKNLPETAYFYVIRYENKEPKTGSVTVIR